jgi:hypothetical protein
MAAVASGEQYVAELKLLMDKMADERRKWGRSTWVYGAVYIGIRVVLIVSSAIVAADKNLNILWLLAAVPVLALVVTILTTIDTWMKPRDKWRGFMGDRDDLDDLIIRAQGSTQDNAAIEKVRIDFSALRQRHREKNVY